MFSQVVCVRELSQPTAPATNRSHRLAVAKYSVHARALTHNQDSRGPEGRSTPPDQIYVSQEDVHI